MGADYLEQDVVATGDDQLVVLHDIHLDRVTDVTDQFPARHREDGRYYVRDFTLDEIRTLRVHERTNADGSWVYPERAQSTAAADDDFRVHTFSEELAYIDELQKRAGRTVGIYPEIKRPAWHKRNGFDITPAFLEALARADYQSRSDPVYLQCFDDQELRRIREEFDSDLKLIQLIGNNAWGEAETDYEKMLTAPGLAQLSKTVDGIGPWIEHLYRLQPNDAVLSADVVKRAHHCGLAVHPFTFRRDDLPPGFESFAELLRFAIDELSIDGLFTDFPDLVCSRLGR